MDSILMAFIGGIIIGLSALLLLLLNGRIMGVSGIIGGFLDPKETGRKWRLASILGFIAGGAVLYLFQPSLFSYEIDRSWFAIAVAGLFVGFGTQLGGGCTSGHGVCGVSRLSPRSIAATTVFILTGMITVYILGVL